MNFSEIKDKSDDELKELYHQLKKESMNLRFQRVTGELEKTSRIREVRRSIARILTLLNNKKQVGVQDA